MFLVLQESLAAKRIPKHNYHDTKRDAPLKISIQDKRQFPSLQRNVIELDVGYLHHILVSVALNCFLFVI